MSRMREVQGAIAVASLFQIVCSFAGEFVALFCRWVICGREDGWCVFSVLCGAAGSESKPGLESLESVIFAKVGVGFWFWVESGSVQFCGLLLQLGVPDYYSFSIDDNSARTINIRPKTSKSIGSLPSLYPSIFGWPLHGALLFI